MWARLEQLVSSWASDRKVAGSNLDWTVTIFWAPLPSNWFAGVSIMWPAASNML
jgi:hypothetical protein